ncbi:hypothetical protein ACODM8_16625 [Vibrio ostreicida]|uniref:Uncharacterized protein n=1 Tax=Vibrio ostreicida TaxID=526588 RepID=A0ABT8BZA4_9VIBR|nr:hypothetical protein [Vibrio ostreicida]MDN3611375.1 hypothetical protein [Vibrio ostreicida]
MPLSATSSAADPPNRLKPPIQKASGTLTAHVPPVSLRIVLIPTAGFYRRPMRLLSVLMTFVIAFSVFRYGRLRVLCPAAAVQPR